MILLLSLNARYHHTSFAMRYLKANLFELSEHAEIKEFAIAKPVEEILAEITKKNPKILALGIYIWNQVVAQNLLLLVKEKMPNTKIILGGPQFFGVPQNNPLYQLADHVVIGEGEVSFYELIKKIINNEHLNKVIESKKVDLSKLLLPYDLYNDEDIKNRQIFFETSRGCPFGCHFCISALDHQVRFFDIEIVLKELQLLWDKGVRTYKFIDRTFNLDDKRCLLILDFFLKKKPEQFFIHFEIVPELLSLSLKEKLQEFEPETIQLEAGIQSFNTQVCKRIGRKLNIDKVKENISFLINYTKVHLHSDLIIGLPGETIESIADGFDQLITLKVSEIQVGILKKLPGALIAEHDQKFQMNYSSDPPYEIISNSMLNEKQITELKHFAKYFDIFFNSGHFRQSIEKLLDNKSPFEEFLKFSNWMWEKTKRLHSISLDLKKDLLLEYLPEHFELIKKEYYQIRDTRNEKSHKKRQKRHSVL